MSTLAERVLEAIEAPEKTARAAADEVGPVWKWDLRAGAVLTESGDIVARGPWNDPVEGSYALHMVQNDLAAVLRRCSADRRIVELYSEVSEYEGAGDYALTDRANALGEAVRLLAEAYGVSLEQEET